MDYRLLGVTQKPKRNLPPSINRVWASNAGIAPKKINIAGVKIHWNKYQK